KESGRDTHPRVIAQLRTPSYMTAALFIIVSALDIATLALPANPGAVAWRFGTVGAASNYMLTLYFGVVLLCCTAAWFEDRTTLRVAAVGTLVLSVTLLLLLTDFALSALQ